ncbi:hypothetical protein ENKNEFLB_04047 [Nocardioides aquaticus]|uniref:Uncharacterized protein n=1 Tax=Nocardioides aquaticus TaxID=160826 RepID=A0ABX8EP35_9ACTN|nr:hypothetical protein [Nocardioides aquaticus]QVT81635.1 hypothetical protein ENKNEFLB_04047 [Nocardioides aquaticus]
MSPINAVLGAATRPAQAAADLVGSAWRIVGRVDEALERVERLIDDVAATNAHAQAVVDRVDATSLQAAEAVDLGTAELRRAVGALAEHRATLERAGTTAGHAADVLGAQHVDAVAHLLELVPDLLDLVLPALRGMADLTPELDQLTERFDSVGQIVEGLPGAQRLRRRGEEREQDAADEQQPV